MLYADVIVPLAVPNIFTYEVPKSMKDKIAVGQRVVVQFGNRKYYSAVVKSLHSRKPAFETKQIEFILDDKPIWSQRHLHFWEWIAKYYMATLGDVFIAAVPASLRLQSESRLKLKNNNFDRNLLSEKERLIVDKLTAQQTITVNKLAKILDGNPLAIIQNLIKKDIIEVYEFFKQSFKPKFESFIVLSPDIDSKQRFNEILNGLSRSPKQLQTLIAFMTLSQMSFENGIEYIPVSKRLLKEKAEVSYTVIKKLIEKQILKEVKEPILRIKEAQQDYQKEKQLTEEQAAALEQIRKSFENKRVVLFHGITGSGKTEVYIHLIKDTIARGKQVLYLLPEIALTSQIIARLKKIFGDKVGFYHSKFSDNERAEVFFATAGEYIGKHYDIIVGVRSSLFLPFKNLGLIIVDEEHERTYKQSDRAPRYNARDSAIYLAHLLDAFVVLGSATPSIESYYNAQKGKYGYVELRQRYGNKQLPLIFIADERRARQQKQMKSLFHPVLIEKMTEAFSRGEQVILFRNRRGFAPYLECRTCGWIPKCENCDVSLTYHSDINKLVCHYCGYTVDVPSICHVCGDRAMEIKGFGTQRVEQEIKIFFPDIKIKRLDLDSTRKKYAYEEILSEFADGKYDVLVGTQMIAKGLDFARVNLVGVLNIDNLLFYPDFRAYEQVFQLLVQVSGRAGRRDKQGEVVIQTSHPEHDIFKIIVSGDYQKMYENEILLRKKFQYPPFYRLIKIGIKHSKKDIVNNFSELLATNLKKVLGKRVYGPQVPVISKIKNLYIREILIKLENKISLSKVKELIITNTEQLKDFKGYSSVLVYYDVDP